MYSQIQHEKCTVTKVVYRGYKFRAQQQKTVRSVQSQVQNCIKRHCINSTKTQFAQQHSQCYMLVERERFQILSIYKFSLQRQFSMCSHLNRHLRGHLVRFFFHQKGTCRELEVYPIVSAQHRIIFTGGASMKKPPHILMHVEILFTTVYISSFHWRGSSPLEEHLTGNIIMFSHL